MRPHLPTRRHRYRRAVLGGVVLATLLAGVAPGRAASAAVTPPPGPTAPLVFGAAAGQSLSLAWGVTHATYSADPFENPAAVASAKQLLSAEPVYQNQALMGFGVGNPEPAPGVYDWSGLDRRMTTIQQTGGTPVLTLVGAPDWMKGGTPGSTDFNTVPTAPTPAHYQDFADLAVMAARRYPQVKTIDVWNEMKGFWDAKHSQWAYIQYTQMYNVVYDTLKAYNPALRIGGPYVTIESYASSAPAPAGSLTGPWGTVDPRSLQALSYWLTHKHGADFVALDGRANTSSGGYQADDFTSAEKFAAVDAWVRQRTALPIWWMEFYNQPPGTSYTPDHQNATLTTAIAEMALSGATTALQWSPEADPTDPTKRGYLWTYAENPGGGQPSPLYTSFETFNRYFNPALNGGTPPDDVTVVVNPTASPLAYQGSTLAPYEVRYVVGSSQTVTGPPAAAGGDGASATAAGPAAASHITTVAGGSGSGIAKHVAQAPAAVAVANGVAYVSDTVDNVVRAVGLGPAPDQRLERILAGTGAAGSSGDGGAATAANLNDPEGLAADSAGDVFIADTGGNRVREVTPDGRIRTVAGNGVFGDSGDGGPAASAHLAHPTALAVDAGGDLYIADDGNNAVREVSPSGVISTVAGNGTQGFSGDGGPATSAQLDGPTGVAVTGQGLAISDGGNDRVRLVSGAGTITTLAGTGTPGAGGDGGPATAAQLAAPAGVAAASDGSVYVADDGNSRIRRIGPDGTITTVAGTATAGYSGDGGPATSAELDHPQGVATDTSGDLWVVDRDNRRIREVDTTGTITSPIGGGLYWSSGDGGPAAAAEMNGPAGAVVDAAGDIYVSDSINNRVRKITPGGLVSTVAGNGAAGYSGDNGPATAAELWYPMGLALDAAGDLYVADYYNNRIREVSPGGTITTFAGYGTYGFAGDGGGATKAWLEQPTGVAVDAAGVVYIVDAGNERIRKVTTAWHQITTIAGNGTTGSSGDGGPATSAQLDQPGGIAVDGAGDVFVADSLNNRIREITAAGIITTFAGTGAAAFTGDGAGGALSFPSDVAVDRNGDVFVADTGNDRVREVAAATRVVTTLAGTGGYGFAGDGGPANWSRLAGPLAVAVSADGSTVVVADTGNNRVRRVA